jgi:poly(3-hydroxyalkanoate) synthetase
VAIVVVTTRDGTRLDVEQHGSGNRSDDAVILCHGIIQNVKAFAVPSFSVIDLLVSHGFTVYALNLRGRRGESAHHDLGTYVDEDAAAVVDVVASRHRSVSWIGHSMGGLIGVSIERPLHAVVALASPLLPGDARLRELSVDKALFKLSRLLASKTRAFPGRQYAGVFSLLRNAIERGLPWPLPLWKPGSFDDDDLVFTLRHAFSSDGHHVLADLCQLAMENGQRAGRVPVSDRLRALKSPLLCVAGAVDGIAPADSVHALFSRAGSPVKRYLEVDAGHIDLITGRRARADVWEPVITFVREQQQRP